MPFLSMKVLFYRIENNSPFIFKPISHFISRKVSETYLNPNLHAEVNAIEQHLRDVTWFSGEEWTAVDILMWFILEALIGRFIDDNSYPNIKKFVVRIHQRAAFKRALLKGCWSFEEHSQYWKFLKC